MVGSVRKGFAVFALLAVGCSIGEERTRLNNAIEHFHELFNLGHFDEIYTEATSKYRNFATLDENRNKLRTARGSLGNARKFKIIEMQPHLSPWGRAFFIRCVTDFDKGGQAVESFVLISSSDGVQVEVYAIASPALQTSGLATK